MSKPVETPKRIVLNKKDCEELKELYRTAQTTPVIKLSMSSPSFADTAWDAVRKKMDELDLKYGFDPKKIKGINPDGEVVFP